MSIELKGISKTFGAFEALKNVSLEVRDGELLALLGPSGSGKTTLLRIIAGLDVPDPTPETLLRFDGVSVDWNTSTPRHVGFVFQHYALFRTMTVFENVAFGLRVRPKEQRPSDETIRRKVMELLSLIQLDAMAHRYPSQLSGGQRQRVALARALAIEPKILLLDEPFGALDAKVRQSLRRWLRRLHDDIHVTSVLVTHDQEEALEVADRVVIMNHGRIEQVGSPDEVFHKPASPFVMDFLGNVNLFHARNDGGSGTAAWAFGKAPSGREARILVRPHDLDISLTAESPEAVQARVFRIQTAGSLVKVELTTQSGEEALVEIPHEKLRELGIRKDDAVFIKLKEQRVFVEDYSI